MPSGSGAREGLRALFAQDWSRRESERACRSGGAVPSTAPLPAGCWSSIEKSVAQTRPPRKRAARTFNWRAPNCCANLCRSRPSGIKAPPLPASQPANRLVGRSVGRRKRARLTFCIGPRGPREEPPRPNERRRDQDKGTRNFASETLQRLRVASRRKLEAKLGQPKRRRRRLQIGHSIETRRHFARSAGMRAETE